MQFWFQYFYVAQPKIIADHPGYHLGGPLGEPGFFVSCSTGSCMMCCQRVTHICDCNNNVSVPWRLLRLHQLTEVSLVQLSYCDDEFSLTDQINSVGIYIFAKSFEIDYSQVLNCSTYWNKCTYRTDDGNSIDIPTGISVPTGHGCKNW